MDKGEETKLRNGIWRRLSKSVPGKNIQRLAARFREAFRSVFCRCLATEPNTPSPSVSGETPLDSTSEHVSILEELISDDNSDSMSVQRATTEPEAAGHSGDSPEVNRQDALKPRRPLYRPRPLKTSDVGLKLERQRFRPMLTDPRVMFAGRKQPNCKQQSESTHTIQEQHTAVVHDPSRPYTVDMSAGSSATVCEAIIDLDDVLNSRPADTVTEPAVTDNEINVDEVIIELDGVLNSRQDTLGTQSATDEFNVEDVISELDEIIHGGQSCGKSGKGAEDVLRKTVQAAGRTTAPDIDDIIDEEYNYYGI